MWSCTFLGLERFGFIHFNVIDSVMPVSAMWSCAFLGLERFGFIHFNVIDSVMPVSAGLSLLCGVVYF